MADVDEILRKYGKRISNEIDETQIAGAEELSREYIRFKQDMMPELSRYERIRHERDEEGILELVRDNAYLLLDKENNIYPGGFRKVTATQL